MRFVPALAAVLWLGVLSVYGGKINGAMLGKSLPLVCVATMLYAGFRILRAGESTDRLNHHRALCLWSAWALLMLSKQALRPSIYHYGFVLAMPAALLLIVVLIHWIPEKLKREHGRGQLFRAIALTFILFFALSHFLVSNDIYGGKTYPVGEGANLMLDFDPAIRPHGAIMADAMDFLDEHMAQDDSLLAIPEGSLLYFMLRRDNPTPYYFFTPMDVDWFGGQDAMIAQLEATPPDTIVLWEADMSEYGVPHFGYDDGSGRAVLEWIETNYHQVRKFGEGRVAGEAIAGYRILQSN